MSSRFLPAFGILLVLLVSGCVSDAYDYSNVSDAVKTDYWKIRRIVKDATDDAFLYDLNMTKWHNVTAVTVVYEYKEQWLVDEYFRTTRQFSDIFKGIFDFNASIMLVAVGNYRQIEDEYGNSKDILLARSAMDRETYYKINWQNFNHDNLDKVTEFEFYGSSVLKGLGDLRGVLENWPEA
jgi:hypothetical protein